MVGIYLIGFLCWYGLVTADGKHPMGMKLFWSLTWPLWALMLAGLALPMIFGDLDDVMRKKNP